MENLFSETKTNQPPILLIDASGSTVSTTFHGDMILNKIKKIIQELKETQYRIIFWNSDRREHAFFTASNTITKEKIVGVKQIPYVVKQEELNGLFAHISPNINGYCLTSPHIAFKYIPSEWISKTEVTKIYFITDGEMGWGGITSFDTFDLRKNLANAIKQLVDKNKMIQLNIIAVEAQTRKFDTTESMANVAGCDVYNVLMENSLTNCVTKFTSYSLDYPNGYVNISRMNAPQGFVPFQDKYFSETKTRDFITYLHKLIQESSTDENKLLKLVQDISPTVTTLIKDKPQKLQENIIATFYNLFDGTAISGNIVKMIITDSVEKETSGKSEMLSSYRSNLKDLFKESNKMLEKDVLNAIQAGEHVISFPSENTIISSSSKIVEHRMQVKGSWFPKCAFKINDIMIPILPKKYQTKRPEIADQCLRQWTRAIVSEIYNVDRLGDVVIYLVLGNVLQVVLTSDSLMPFDVKSAFRKLGTVMLEKKRANSTQTELARLEEGLLPIPNNGKIENFYQFMDKVNSILGTNLKPFSLWYCICLAMDNKNLIDNQLKHCVKDLDVDFGNGLSLKDYSNVLSLLKEKNVIKPIQYLEVPLEDSVEYKCIITLEDLKDVGGYSFSSHKTSTEQTCSPNFMVSEEGFKGLTTKPEFCVCPACYTPLSEKDFIKVGKKQDAKEEKFTLPFTTYFKKVVMENKRQSGKEEVSNSPNTGTLIVMKGTVGAGKSFISQKISEKVKSLGGSCYVEGTDKYTKGGASVKSAIKTIAQNLAKAKKDQNKNVFIIIDTCGDVNNGTVYFNTDFGNNWKIVELFPNLITDDLEGYLYWSLRNVIRRNKPEKNDNFYLNSETASVDTCINVHLKKASAHFRDMPNLHSLISRNKNDAIAFLNEKADLYAIRLEKEMPFEKQVEDVVNFK